MNKRNWVYWALTLPFGLFALAGLGELVLIQHTIESVGAVGYPWYVAYIVGVAKLVGGVVIVFGNKFPTLKEWAYAGFMIEFSGALVSHAVMGGADKMVLLIVTMAVTLTSHRYWQQNFKPRSAKN